VHRRHVELRRRRDLRQQLGPDAIALLSAVAAQRAW